MTFFRISDFAGSVIDNKMSHPLEHQPYSEQRHNAPRKRLKFWQDLRDLQPRDKVTSWLTLCIFIATAVYACAAISQCQTGQKELRAYVSFSSMNSTDGVRRVDKLPASHIWLKGKSHEAQPNSPLYVLNVDGLLDNSGKTPAQRVRYDLEYITRDYATAPGALPCPDIRDAFPGPTIFMSGGIKYPAGPVALALNQADANLIQQKKLALYLYGCISYEDVFAKFHCTETCGVYDPDTGHFSFCANNNQLDECSANYADQ
jgi:hypothetical protein